MRRDKTVARIILIFSVVDVVLAAPATVRQGHLGVAEDVTAASVKRAESNLVPSASSTSGEPPQLPPPGPVGSTPEALGNELDSNPPVPSTSSADKASQLPPSGPEAQDDQHSTISASSSSVGKAPQLLPSEPEAQEDQHSTTPASSSSSAGKAPQLPPSGLETQEDQHSTTSASTSSADKAPQLLPSGLETQDDQHSTTSASTSSAGKAPQLPSSGPEVQEDQHSTTSASSLSADDPPLSHSKPAGSMQEASGIKPDLISLAPSTSSPELEEPGSDPEFEEMMRQMDMRAKASAGSDSFSSHGSSLGSWGYHSALADDLQSLPSTRYRTPPQSPRPPMHVNWPTQEVSSFHYETDTASEASDTPATEPKPHRFFSDGVKENIKVVAAAGAVFGAYVGVLHGIKKIEDTVSSRAETVGRDLTDLVGRGAGTHSRSGKNSVSRGLANSRDEGLRLLNVLTRRALERLD